MRVSALVESQRRLHSQVQLRRHRHRHGHGNRHGIGCPIRRMSRFDHVPVDFRKAGLGLNATAGGEVASEADLEELPLPEGSTGLPVLGETLQFLWDRDALGAQKRAMHGPVYKSHVFGRPTVFVAGIDNIRKVMEDPSLLKANPIATFRKLFGEHSIMSIDGPEHTFIRRLMAKAFKPNAVRSYIPRVVHTAEDCLENWSNQDAIKFTDELRKFSIATTAHVVLGYDQNVDAGPEILEWIQEWCNGLFTFGIDLPFTKFGRALAARQRLMEFVTETAENSRYADDTALAYMMAARDEDGRQLDLSQVSENGMVMLIAAYETTTTAIVAAMLELNNHPAVLKKLREEQERIVAEHGPAITSEALDQMTFLEASIKESMRVRPVAVDILRSANRTFELNGCRIPKDWQVFVGTGSTTRFLDDQWEDDPKFNPERFIATSGKKPRCFNPFGTGTHNCIGAPLAMVQMKVLFALIARHFDVTVENPNPRMRKLPAPEPFDGMPLTIVKRAECTEKRMRNV